MDRSRVEISRAALRANVRTLRAVAGADRILCAVVKANAYGHGMREVAGVLARDRAFRSGWFGVDSLGEALALRDFRVRQPILVLGYVPIGDARAAVRADVRVTVATHETVRALAAAARSLRRTIPVHVKVETGTQRQGVLPDDLPAFLRRIRRLPQLVLEGISTHLADVEDTGPDGFAAVQLERFDRAVAIAERIVGNRLLRHASASAATMLFPGARFDLMRCGIALYGLWPSDRVRHTVTTATKRGRYYTKRPRGIIPPTVERGWRGDDTRARCPPIDLHPVLTWKTVVGPIHDVPAGAPVGYGCTERVRRKTRIAVLPVGYWDGYDRKLSSIGAVLIRGKRCKVIGRVCMNMVIVDVTDVPRVRLEDAVVLLGRQGREEVTAEELAGKIGTIHYEAVTRINPMLPRKVV